MHTRKEQMEAFGRFLDILDELREKCPWDRKQTNESLRPNTIEETYELCDALMKDDKKDICKELGDVLLHVAFYAKIGSETGDFDIKDVCDCLCEKLIFRHPHVFGEVKAETAEKVTENWEQLKMKEKDGNKMVLSGVPSALPSLIKAYRIQDKARNVGFDWEERSQVWTKVKEEIGEFEAEVENMDKEKAEAEFGDVMFSLINAARLYKINPDNALELTNQKFIRRFNYLEEHTIKQGKNLKDMTLEEMDDNPEIDSWVMKETPISELIEDEKQKLLLAPRLYPFSRHNHYGGNFLKRWASKTGYYLLMSLLNRVMKLRAGANDELIDNCDLPYYMAASDVIFIQRKDILNSASIPLAFLFHKVVIGPNIGNIGEILQDTGNPVFHPDNKFDIIRALEAARQLSARRKGEDNYAYAIENMNSGKIGKEYAELYRNLANLSL